MKKDESTSNTSLKQGFNDVTILKPTEVLSQIALNLYGKKVPAGFPSPATDFMEGKLDLNEHLIKNPPATFFVRISGDSMIGAGIHPDDLLVVDRSIDPKYTKITITEEMSFHIWGVVTYVIHKP